MSPRHSFRPSRVLTPQLWLPRGEASYDDRGRQIVIWQGIPGEEARIERVGMGQHQDHARWLEARRPSPHRREPPCPKYHSCGGCPIMHVDDAGQTDARLSIVRGVLARFELEHHTPTEVVPSPDGVMGYRHVVKLAFDRNDRGAIRVGAYGRHSHRVVPIPECLVAHPKLVEATLAVAHKVIDLDIWPYDEQTGEGLLRHVVLRRSRATGEILVTYIATGKPRMLWTLADAVAEEMGEIAGSWLHLNREGGNAIYAPINPDQPNPFIRLNGRLTIEEEIAGVRMAVGPGDFFQANPSVADRMVSDVVEALEPWRERPVVDLYSGVGTLALPLAKAHGWARGIEVVPGAVERAEESARRNHLAARFLAGTVAQRLPELLPLVEGRGPVVVVDPARRGIDHEVHDALPQLDPSRLIYISCNPQALGRDLERLAEKGWKLERLRAYDMFPQTAHVELLAELAPATPPTGMTRGPRRRVVRPS